MKMSEIFSVETMLDLNWILRVSNWDLCTWCDENEVENYTFLYMMYKIMHRWKYIEWQLPKSTINRISCSPQFFCLYFAQSARLFYHSSICRITSSLRWNNGTRIRHIHTATRSRKSNRKTLRIKLQTIAQYFQHSESRSRRINSERQIFTNATMIYSNFTYYCTVSTQFSHSNSIKLQKTCYFSLVHSSCTYT